MIFGDLISNIFRQKNQECSFDFDLFPILELSDCNGVLILIFWLLHLVLGKENHFRIIFKIFFFI